MTDNYNYALLKDILSVKINGKKVWKDRISHQTQFLHLLEEVFGTDISTESFAFYPKRIYFATSLTADPEYIKSMLPVWHKIVKAIEKFECNIYAPFDQSNPHSKIPDGLDSYEIRDLDHINVLKSEVALMDLNRPSHGVGQEIEMSFSVPKIGFSQAKVSRMVKGMPGTIILNYKDENELISLMKKIFERTNYKKEPFYLDKCSRHITKSIFKGENCLNCEFRAYLHAV
jgi:hypothetical protein